MPGNETADPAAAPTGVPQFRFSIPAPEDSLVYVVDDEPGIRAAVVAYLERKGFPVRGFASGEGCLRALEEAMPVLLVADIRMPGIGGRELVVEALAQDPDLAVVMLTAVEDPRAAVELMKMGVADYLVKPVDLDELGVAVERALRRRAEAIYRRQVEAWVRDEVKRLTAAAETRSREVERFTLQMLQVLTRVIELKDPYLKGHSERVAELAARMGRALGLGDRALEDLRVAGLLHDLGQVAVRESVLQKKGGLSREEFETIKQSVRIGAQLLEPFENLAGVRRIVLHFRERWNGSGYPDGLRGEAIPLECRVLGIAEAYDALTSERPHRPAYSRRDALETLRGAVGVWFDARTFGALEEVLAGRIPPAAGEASP